MRTRPLAGRLLPLLPLLLVTVAACAGTDTGTGIPSVGGSAAPRTTSSVSEQEQRLRYAQCMRAHGVPMPDPGADGSGVKDSVDRDTLIGAQQACREFEPVMPPDMRALKAELGREFSRCMRANGFPDFPDPEADGHVADVPLAIRDDPRYTGTKSRCDEHVRSYSPAATNP